MIGTCLGAFLFGPWFGALIGITTNLLEGLIIDESFIRYTIVNASCGLVVGFISTSMRYKMFTFKNISKLFAFTFITGAVVGIFSSVFSLYLRFKYNFRITQEAIKYIGDRADDKNSHLTYKLTNELLDDGYAGVGDSILNFLYIDVLVIIPDKIYSVATAIVLVLFWPRITYYINILLSFSKNYSKDINYPPIRNISLVCFLVLVALSVLMGYNIDDSIDKSRNQHNIWIFTTAISVLLSLALNYTKYRKTSITVSQINNYHLESQAIEGGTICEVYRDVIRVLIALIATYFIFASRYDDQNVIQAIENGIGISALFFISAYLPDYFRKYMRVPARDLIARIIRSREKP